MNVKILVYADTAGVPSARRLWQKLEEVRGRPVAAGNRPRNCGIYEFRRQTRADSVMGLVSLTTLVPNDIKERVHASKGKVIGYVRRHQAEARLSAR